MDTTTKAKTHQIRQKLRSELAAIVDEIVGLKALRRESLQPRWTWKEAKALEEKKFHATSYCCALEHLRGKLHCPKKFATLDEQREHVNLLIESLDGDMMLAV